MTNRCSPRRHPLVLLALLPTSLRAAEWSAPTSGRWLDPANWSTAAVPTSPTPATINLAGAYTVTVDASTTTGPLTLDDPDATLLIDTSTSPSLNFTPGNTLLSAGTLTINQFTTNTANPFTLASGATLTNHALINFTGTGGVSSPTLTRSAISGALVNTGTIQALDPAPGVPNPLFRIAGSVTNSGTITTGPRSSLQFNSTFTQNAGTLAGNITFVGLAFNHNGGAANLVTFANPFSSVSLNFGAGATNGTFAVAIGTVNLPTLPAGNTLYVGPGATANFTSNTNNGHLLLNRPAPGATVNPATAAATLAYNSSNSSAPFTNNGTLDLDNPNSPPSTFPAYFVNNGILHVAHAAGIDGANENKLRYLGMGFTNNGDVNVDPGSFALLRGPSAYFNQNSGTLTTHDSFGVDGGNFNFNGGSIVGTVFLSSENVLTISPAATGPAHFTLTPGDGPIQLVGNVPGAVTLNLRPGAQSLGPIVRTPSNLTNAGAIRTDDITTRPTLMLGTSGNLTLTNTGTIDGYTPVPPDNGTAAPTSPFGAILTVAGSLTNTGSITARSMSVRNTLTQNAGTINVTTTLLISPNGTFNFNGGTLTGLPITLSTGATLNISPSAGPANFSFNASGTLHAPHLAPGSVLNLAPLTFTPAAPSVVTADLLANEGTITLKPASVLKLPAPLTNPGTIDLQSTSTLLLLDYTGTPPVDDVRNQLLAHHLTSSTASAAQRLAYIDSAVLSPQAATAITLNQPFADATTIIIKLTLTGDANLDGTITADDYALLDQGYAAGGSIWTQGDFNYDGQVTSADYLLLDTAYAQAHPPSPSFLSQRESLFGAAYVSELLATIPEPASLAVFAATFSLFRRRRTAL